MILVDKNIRKLVEKGMLIVSNYKPENLGCVSYDLTISDIIIDDKECKEYVLKPQEFVMIKTNEEIKIPTNMVGKVGEKNSLLRLGLFVSAPIYHPGHQTYIFLRVVNMSNKEIKLQENFKIAQIFFETLTEEPDEPYNKKANASFNNENKYVRYGKYEDTYKKIVRKKGEDQN